MMKKLIGLMVLTGILGGNVSAQEKPIYENNFEKTEVDKVPEGFLVLDGGFAVKEEGGNKFFELPGAPLESYGAQFGPAENNGIAITARIHGTGKGRRFPTFGVGLNGAGGYRLEVVPAKKALELYKGEELLSSIPFTWESGSWTWFKLQVRKVGDNQFKVEGKAWPQSGQEPATWLIAWDEKNTPSNGRPSIWGKPFSNTPIRYDDITVIPAKP